MVSGRSCCMRGQGGNVQGETKGNVVLGVMLGLDPGSDSTLSDDRANIISLNVLPLLMVKESITGHDDSLCERMTDIMPYGTRSDRQVWTSYC